MMMEVLINYCRQRPTNFIKTAFIWPVNPLSEVNLIKYPVSHKISPLHHITTAVEQ